MNVSATTRKMVMIALFTALGTVMTFISFPLLPAAEFLKYDPADVPALIVTFMYGVPAGLVMMALVSLFQSLFISPDFPYGAIMHFIASGTLLTVSGLIYRFRKTQKMALIAMLGGTLCMALIMIPANMVLTPIYKGAPPDAIKAMIVPAIIPFNLLKAGINSVVTFLVYKPVSSFLTRRSQIDGL